MLLLQRVAARALSQCRIQQTWRRRCATNQMPQNIDDAPPNSARTKAWREAQVKYAHHADLLYSSHLETQQEHVSYKKRKWLQQKQIKVATHAPSLDQLQLAREEHQAETPLLPPNWMDDYEFYEGAAMDADGNLNSSAGTADAAVPPSRVPCSGCGAHLHCASQALPGFIPAEIFRGRTDKELKTIVCQRCHFLEHYNIALDVEVSADSYVETIACIRNEYALAIVIVDLLDFPCSIWPGMAQLLGPKRPVFVVGNKVDLLPRDSNAYLEHVKRNLAQQAVQCGGFDALNIKYVSLISAKTGYGIEELITQLQKIWLHKGDVYLLGCTNVGKSSLFNRLLNSDYCRPEATDLVRKATTCPWPGTTLQMLKFPILRPSELRIYQRFQRLFSERGQKAAAEKLRRDQARKDGSVQAAQLIGTVGRTFDGRGNGEKASAVNDTFAVSAGTQPIVSLNERAKEYRMARWCYDTPGVMHPDQIANLLTTEELLRLAPTQMIKPRAYRLKRGMSVFLAGLGRLDFVDCKAATATTTIEEDDWIKIHLFCSLQLPVVITPTAQADEVYRNYLGTEVLGVPSGAEERLARWPGLQPHAEHFTVEGGSTQDSSDYAHLESKQRQAAEARLNCDVVLSSAGWIGLRVPRDSVCTFRAWTPHARGIHLRLPALIPHAERLIGKRIRHSLAYNLSKPFVFRK